jgi:transposase InsO family protein
VVQATGKGWRVSWAFQILSCGIGATGLVVRCRRGLHKVRRRGDLLADITYIPTEQGFLYLAAVMDLCTRKIVGWALRLRSGRDHMRTELTLAALMMAVQSELKQNLWVIESTVKRLPGCRFPVFHRKYNASVRPPPEGY